MFEVALEERTADADLDAQLLVEELADLLARNLVQQRDRVAVALLDLEAVAFSTGVALRPLNGLSGSPSASR